MCALPLLQKPSVTRDANMPAAQIRCCSFGGASVCRFVSMFSALETAVSVATRNWAAPPMSVSQTILCLPLM